MLADINGNLADLRSEAAMASQRFCLRWNNHQSNLLSVFDQLLHDESFVDVTLAVEGQLLRAHKMVLSACSPYFQALFVGHPDKHPIVILKDVPYVDMRSLLDFMYRGEVSVDQDRLTAFLRVAESLRIKGLTEVNEDKCDLPSITSSLLNQNQNAAPPPPPSLHRINQLGQHHHLPQKRYHHMSSHPLLGSALTAPKRKRGRPRKLSGSSDTPMDTSVGQEQHGSGSELVQGSPEMMEMKMSLDFQGDVGLNSSAGSSASNGSNKDNNSAAAQQQAKDEPTENGTDQSDAPLLVRIKAENEPTPSTSAQGFIPSLPSDITFEICSVNDPHQDDFEADDESNNSTSNSPAACGGEESRKASKDGVHFLTSDSRDSLTATTTTTTMTATAADTEPEVRKQLLEYLIQNDGSVVCKWCGEVLPSRTRWYRHKYKLHVTTSTSTTQQSQSTQPQPLFKCHSCNAYFKSRKGYIGHLSSRHSSDENDENREEQPHHYHYHHHHNNNKSNSAKTAAIRKTADIGKGPDWEQQREKEEKLVADIIDRVKRECEAQGETVSRRGYSRRTTVMNSTS